MDSLSMCRDTRGSSSDTWMPASLVGMALNPLLGLGSQVSTWLGPPSSQRRMQDSAFAFPGGPALAIKSFRARYWLSLKPSRLSEPTRRKSRRPRFSPVHCKQPDHFMTSLPK